MYSRRPISPLFRRPAVPGARPKEPSRVLDAELDGRATVTTILVFTRRQTGSNRSSGR